MIFSAWCPPSNYRPDIRNGFAYSRHEPFSSCCVRKLFQTESAVIAVSWLGFDGDKVYAAMQTTVDEEALTPILAHLTEMIRELALDMQRIQWRLAKLERQYGTPGNEQ